MVRRGVVNVGGGMVNNGLVNHWGSVVDGGLVNHWGWVVDWGLVDNWGSMVDWGLVDHWGWVVNRCGLVGRGWVNHWLVDNRLVDNWDGLDVGWLGCRLVWSRLVLIIVGLSLIGHISDIAVISVGGVLDVLDPDVGINTLNGSSTA